MTSHDSFKALDRYVLAGILFFYLFPKRFTTTLNFYCILSVVLFVALTLALLFLLPSILPYVTLSWDVAVVRAFLIFVVQREKEIERETGEVRLIQHNMVDG